MVRRDHLLLWGLQEPDDGRFNVRPEALQNYFLCQVRKRSTPYSRPLEQSGKLDHDLIIIKRQVRLAHQDSSIFQLIQHLSADRAFSCISKPEPAAASSASPGHLLERGC